MKKIAALIGAGAMLLSVAGPAFAVTPAYDIWSSSNSGANLQNGAPTQTMWTGTSGASAAGTSVGWSAPSVGAMANSGANNQTYAWHNTLGTGAASAGAAADVRVCGWFGDATVFSGAYSGDNYQSAWSSNTAYTGSANADTNLTSHGVWSNSAGAVASTGENTQQGGSSWFSVSNTMGTGAAWSGVNANVTWY